MGNDSSRQLSSISGGKLVSFGPNEEWPTAVKLHKDLLKLHHIEFKESDLSVKRADDTNSDSSGEITGTDSGRGGSEEDSHSNGRASPPVPPAIPKRAPRTKFKPKPPTYPEHIENHKKHSTSSDISSLGRDDSNYNLKNVSFDSTVPKRPPIKKHVSFQSDFCLNNTPRSGDYTRDQSVFPKYPSLGYSAGNINDRHFDIDDDDNTTTTSGSYMVDFDNESTDYVHSRMRDVVV
ncbi:hypothetical protein LOTGIDRAFT_228637 [Lottia gigantea]|uniref:Uncharacterized protein n=1 Tax=Lottia gigantea TaxID=225164 RepID=V4AFN0_LOTGI|nr:hypothetical protein LOTGIDRAFT_228637 [Lottia gigantea]ESO93925.1 hypothetical protein LOTGIDRAFT_228637 [Lottia gigantea]